MFFFNSLKRKLKQKEQSSVSSVWYVCVISLHSSCFASLKKIKKQDSLSQKKKEDKPEKNNKNLKRFNWEENYLPIDNYPTELINPWATNIIDDFVDHVMSDTKTPHYISQ